MVAMSLAFASMGLAFNSLEAAAFWLFIAAMCSIGK